MDPARKDRNLIHLILALAKGTEELFAFAHSAHGLPTAARNGSA